MRTTTTKNNACLLHALNDAPDAAPATDDQIQGLRAAIAAAAVEYKHMIVNDKTLDAWVKLTADVDTETWAAGYQADNAMSDQIALIIWAITTKKGVWVWRRGSNGTYQNDNLSRFGGDTAAAEAKHVLFDARRAHYDAIRITPHALRRLSLGEPGPTAEAAAGAEAERDTRLAPETEGGTSQAAGATPKARAEAARPGKARPTTGTAARNTAMKGECPPPAAAEATGTRREETELAATTAEEASRGTRAHDARTREAAATSIQSRVRARGDMRRVAQALIRRAEEIQYGHATNMGDLAPLRAARAAQGSPSPCPRRPSALPTPRASCR